jgi:catechol 2,3-dioxygenase-like lactoylglutathione lyase family enzyme
MPQPQGAELEAIRARRAELKERYLIETAKRPASTVQGVHHLALICRDVEETIRFYQELLGFPLVELVENRDYAGSNHFFFDIGNGNLLAFFDFPGLDLAPYQEVLGGHHHLCISVTKEKWDRLVAKLRETDTELHFASGTSVYFQDPDGVRLELISDPLGEMYGTKVL